VALHSAEINRKLLHIGSGTLIPAFIFYMPAYTGQKWIAPVVLGVCWLGSVVVELLRFRNPWVQALFMKSAGSMLRESERKSFTGSTHLFGAALVCSVIFIQTPAIAAMVLSAFILGDAIAAIVGLSIGKIKIGKKSLEGTLACFVLCFVLFVFVFPLVPGLLQSYGGSLSLPVALLGSFAIALLELVPVRLSRTFTVNDNFIVPVLTGLILLVPLELMATGG